MRTALADRLTTNSIEQALIACCGHKTDPRLGKILEIWPALGFRTPVSRDRRLLR